MKLDIAVAFLLLGLSTVGIVSACTTGQPIFINELHYDNASSDQNEGIEIAGPAGTDLNGYSLVLYNGNGGASYNTISLSGTIMDDTTTGFGFLNFAATGIQNGAPDGIALVDSSNTVLQFLSYEGQVTATNGVANGLTSTDIGVSETSSTPVGQSLQLSGTGECSNDFTWTAPGTSTFGSINNNQSFGDAGPVAAPTDAPTGALTVFTIQDIQGTGSESPLVGDTVSVQGAIVTALFVNGFAMQQPSTDPSTSSGIFVFTGSATPATVGDEVDVSGTVAEFFGETQISNASVEIISTGNAVPSPTTLSLPTADIADFESLEGMLVSVTTPIENSLVVSEYFNLDQFGVFAACSASNDLGRVFQYTQLNSPDPVGFLAFQEEISRSCITLDDNSSARNPDPLLVAGLSPLTSANSLRGGAKILSLIGVLRYAFGEYTISPLAEGDLVFEDRNFGRQEALDKIANLKPAQDLKKKEFRVVSTNLLNFFTSIDTGDTPFRGADDDAEFLRQEEKTIGALNDLDADILGLVEVENTISNAAVAHVVRKLNELQEQDADTSFVRGRRHLSSKHSREYTAVSLEADLDKIGTDSIKVDILYDKSRLNLVGFATLTDEDVSQTLLDAVGGGEIFASKSRVPLAATFELERNNRYVTVVVNHFKSKSPSGSSGVEADMDDGAGAWNNLRTKSSEALLQWLGTNPTNSPNPENILLLGDLNAYAQEPPITTLTDAGYVDIDATAAAESSSTPVYSYVFDGQWGTLDYILASPSMSEYLEDVFTWHVNADEPDALDYNVDDGSRGGRGAATPAGDPEIFDGSLPFRFSDHDPLVATFSVKKA